MNVTLKHSPDLTLVNITSEETGESYTVIKKSKHMPSKREIECDINSLEIMALKAFAGILDVNPFSSNVMIEEIHLTVGEKKPAKKSTIDSLVDGLTSILGKFGSWANILKNLPPINSTSSSITKWINNRGFDTFAEKSLFQSNIGIKEEDIDDFLNLTLGADMLNYPKD